jgi:hypothetical protein
MMLGMMQYPRHASRADHSRTRNASRSLSATCVRPSFCALGYRRGRATSDTLHSCMFYARAVVVNRDLMTRRLSVNCETRKIKLSVPDFGDYMLLANNRLQASKP